MIISLFDTDILKHNVDVILNIRQLSSTLQNNGHSLSVHRIHGRKDFKDNELAKCFEKEELFSQKNSEGGGLGDRTSTEKSHKYWGF